MITKFAFWTRQSCFAFLSSVCLCSMAQAQGLTQSFSDNLKGGGHGPEMVMIPAGSFTMGDRNGNGPDDEKPAKRVNLSSYAMSRFEVTFAEFDRFVAAVSKRPPSDDNFGRGNMPVINITWEDASGYVHWLSQQTGHTYRLPTEAQWEFAARAGSDSTYFWGTDVNQACFYANVADSTAGTSHDAWLQVNCEDGYSGPAPVGQFSSNPFGVHDLIGNVYEWVQDCYSDNYEVLPTDGRAHENSYCRKRVARGGGWSSPSWHLRASHRQAFPENERRQTLGFRVVRELNDQELAQVGRSRGGGNPQDQLTLYK